jgi:hypothetical protein
MGDAEEIKTVIREWIGLDDQARELQKQQKVLREQKLLLSQKILEFMRENQVDNFNLEGGSSGTIARSVRQTKPPLKRQIVRTQLLLQFADQPQRVAEVLRAIEGVPEGAEDMSVGGTQKELLSRRLPRVPKTDINFVI